MAVVTVNLWAKQGNIKFPDGVEVPFWGFVAAAGREPQLPGPLIRANAGDTLKINLHNNLNDFVSLIFPGQDFIPVPVKENGVIVSYNTHAFPGGSVSYTFTATRPGIFLYESGTRPEKQVPMGLYGAIVVHPANGGALFEKTAYGFNTGTFYDVEKILIFSEVDTRFNLAMGAGDPFNMLDYEPDYWLINGRSFPFTLLPDPVDFLPSQPVSAKINSGVGQAVLLRCINAGSQNHTFRLEGIAARVTAVDSRPLGAGRGSADATDFRGIWPPFVPGDGSPVESWPFIPGTGVLDATYLKNTITIASGESYDLLFTAGGLGQYYLHDRDLHHLSNVGRFPGGMATRLDVVFLTPVTAPGAPARLTCSALGRNRVRLSWRNRTFNEEGFVVERKTGAENFETIAVLTVSGLTEYVDDTVRPATAYAYRIRAYNSKGFSRYSNQCSLTT